MIRAAVTTLALALLAALVLVWAQGGLEPLARWAMEGQRSAQNAMAGVLRSLRAGDAGALAALMGLALSYGLLHAVGPGHGKLLIGAYGAASSVRLAPLAAIALAGSLMQATTAVALVHGGVAVFDWSRERVLGLGEGVLAQASLVAIALIGLWLALRGGRGLLRLWQPAAVPVVVAGAGAPVGLAGGGAAHMQGSDRESVARGPAGGSCGDAGHAPAVDRAGVPAAAVCDHCGHRHGPTAAEVAGLRGWRDAVLLVTAIGIRPCTGALFLLILTWRMGISAAGIAAAYVMALGTAMVTVGVAVLAVLARDGALHWAGRLAPLRPLAPLAELTVGAVVVMVALHGLRMGW